MLRLSTFEVRISLGDRLPVFEQVFIGYPQMANVLYEVKKCKESESCVELLETLGLPKVCDKNGNSPSYIRVLKTCGVKVGTIVIQPKDLIPLGGLYQLTMEVNDA